MSEYNPFKIPEGILVVQRFGTTDKDKKYRGMDGYSWPDYKELNQQISLEYELAGLNQFEAIEDYFKTVNRRYFCDLIYIKLSGDNIAPKHKAFDLTFLGYDYGYYCSSGGSFSVIYQDIVDSKIKELRDFEQYLNNFLLFNSKEIITPLIIIRAELLLMGIDLEDYGGPWLPISIFSVKRKE